MKPEKTAEYLNAGRPPGSPLVPSNIAEFLGDESPWTEGEQWVIKWQFKLLGDFQTALAGAIARADSTNINRLALGFPHQVDGFLAWKRGSLGRRLREAGLEI